MTRMIYRSNLIAPDLQRAFGHVHCRPMPHSMGHDVLSDFADRPADDPVFGLYKNCGFWTHDETAILYNVACSFPGQWADIGCHTMWTSAHLAQALRMVSAIDPMLRVPEFRARAEENLEGIERSDLIQSFAMTSSEFFNSGSAIYGSFAGVVIDGDHCAPCPLEDARNAVKYLRETGAVLFHDFIGRPVQEGVEYLIGIGFQCRVYWTPHMVACCWRGDYNPPNHERDPRIDWNNIRRVMPHFLFERCA